MIRSSNIKISARKSASTLILVLEMAATICLTLTLTTRPSLAQDCSVPTRVPNTLSNLKFFLLPSPELGPYIKTDVQLDDESFTAPPVGLGF